MAPSIKSRIPVQRFALAVCMALTLLALLVALPQTSHALGNGSGGLNVIDGKGKQIEGVTADWNVDTHTVTINATEDIDATTVVLRDVDGHKIWDEEVQSGVISKDDPYQIVLKLKKKPVTVVIKSDSTESSKPSASVSGIAIIVVGAVIAFVSYKKLSNPNNRKKKRF